MPEPIDTYADNFRLLMGAYGAALVFGIRAVEKQDDSPTPVVNVATIRMSVEHLKVMTFLMHQNVLKYQNNLGVRIDLGDEVLKSLKITREEWTRFWAEGTTK